MGDRVSKFGKPFRGDTDSLCSMGCGELSESRMIPRFFLLPFPSISVLCELENLRSIVLESKQASSVPRNNHKEASRTRELGNNILYFLPDWGGCD